MSKVQAVDDPPHSMDMLMIDIRGETSRIWEGKECFLQKLNNYRNICKCHDILYSKNTVTQTQYNNRGL